MYSGDLYPHRAETPLISRETPNRMSGLISEPRFGQLVRAGSCCQRMLATGVTASFDRLSLLHKHPVPTRIPFLLVERERHNIRLHSSSPVRHEHNALHVEICCPKRNARSRVFRTECVLSWRQIQIPYLFLGRRVIPEIN
jgi:hypothetical protein